MTNDRLGLTRSEINLTKPEDSFRTVSRQRLYEQVASQIETMIRNGELVAGDPLPAERELLERFGVGRVTIREALLSLQQKGLIQISNGERARVTRPSADTLMGSLTGAAQVYLSDTEGVQHFQGLRNMVEIAMVRFAASNASQDDLAKIGDALERNRAAKDDPIAFSQTDVEFHLEIARVSRNPLLIGGYKALNGWLTEQRERAVGIEGSKEAAIDAHERIYSAISAGDADGAERMMRDHLERVAAHYWAGVSARSDMKHAGRGPTKRQRADA